MSQRVWLFYFALAGLGVFGVKGHVVEGGAKRSKHGRLRRRKVQSRLLWTEIRPPQHIRSGQHFSEAKQWAIQFQVTGH